MDKTFDAVVIGTGSAGTAAAMALRKRGKSVAIIDERSFGGTCALRGCDPKKVLVAAARALDAAARWSELGVLSQKPELNWPALMRFKRTFTDPVPHDRERTYRDANIVPIRAQARFIDPRTLEAGSDRIQAGHFVIASGAKERHVAKGDDALLTSESFLELEDLPKSLIFAGGGYIAFEFAHIAARAGTKVTILNESDRPLRGFDRDAVDRLVALTRTLGIDIRLETTAESVERNERGVIIHAKSKAGPQRFEAENGVLAAGRVPDIDDLGLENAGVDRTEKGVRVNEYMQSVSNPQVYAVGDAADGGGLPLTPVAGYEGEIAASNILDGNAKAVDFRGLVSMVYTIPPLGVAGLSEEQARESGAEIDVHSGDMSDWYSTRHVASKAAYYKSIAERGTGNILGAAVLGPHAEEQINVLALAIRSRLDKSKIAQTLFAYPTGSSDLEYFTSP